MINPAATPPPPERIDLPEALVERTTPSADSASDISLVPPDEFFAFLDDNSTESQIDVDLGRRNIEN